MIASVAVRPAVTDVPIEQITARAYSIPTEQPESDGTATWDQTTIVVAEASGGGVCGIGYTYGDQAITSVINQTLSEIVVGADAMAPSASWVRMGETVRNAGRPGIAAMAISAVDTALWDLKARLLEVPLVVLLGAVRSSVPIYGSGGFTSLSQQALADQLSGWVADGIPRVKMKVGRDPANDLERVRVAREAIGPDCELFVDANGAYERKQALSFAERFAEFGVSWFEEPVSSDDLEGLRLLRDRAPAGMEITAGEYGFTSWYFERMLCAGAVDCLQADCTRCQGITGLLQASVLCEAHSIQLSAHCGPAIHVHPCCAVIPIRHLEYFADHSRVESLIFDGVPQPEHGELHPDLSRPGNGLELNRKAAKRFAI